MRPREFFILVLLAAIWGASFMFMRVAAASFGPVPLVLFRVVVALICLLPLLAVRGLLGRMREKPWPLFVVGVLNSAVPFSLLAYASISLSAGFTSLLNAMTPMMAAVVGMVWYGQKLRREQWLGLVVGMAGVAVLCGGRMSFKPGGTGWAIVAALGATVSYGVAAHYSRRHLLDLPPLVSAAGSMAGASLALLGPGLWSLPVALPGAIEWGAALALAVVCTGVAYLLYFHLINAAGPTQTASVTFLVPIFAIVWSAVFLREPVTPRMLAASMVIITGTALANGILTIEMLGGGTPGSVVAKGGAGVKKSR